MNVLLTSAGRRTYMVDYFKKALRGEGLVFVANSSMSPALTRGDGWFLSPLIYDEGYIPFLLQKCRELRIDLLVPLFDIDLPVLARHKADFAAAGVTAAVSSPETLMYCNDKYRMFEKLRLDHIDCPATWLDAAEAIRAVEDGQAQWPLVVKPRFGMGSLGIFRACDRMELEVSCAMSLREIQSTYLQYESSAQPADAVIIQRLCRGREYGLDVICDLQGRYVETIVRRKLGMRSGETDEAVILGPEDAVYDMLHKLGEKLAASLMPIGLMDVDVILDDDTEHPDPQVIDINARFGGGYPFSHLAGADVPGAYVLWMQGEQEAGDRLCRGACPGVHGFKDIRPEVIRGTDQSLRQQGF